MTDPLMNARGMYAAFGRGDWNAIPDRFDLSVAWNSSTEAELVPRRGTYPGSAGVATFIAALVGNLEFEVLASTGVIAA